MNQELKTEIYIAMDNNIQARAVGLLSENLGINRGSTLEGINAQVVGDAWLEVRDRIVELVSCRPIQASSHEIQRLATTLKRLESVKGAFIIKCPDYNYRELTARDLVNFYDKKVNLIK